MPRTEDMLSGGTLLAVAADRREGGSRLMARVRERKERHRQRSRIYRIAVAAVGVVLILLGLLLSLPGVPGPGLLVVALGLALLALEFDRAERLLERILGRLERVGETASRASGLQKAVTGAIVLVAAGTAIAAVVFLDVPFLSLRR
jgi:uncharacterized protein (TIGR02611 family)